MRQIPASTDLHLRCITGSGMGKFSQTRVNRRCLGRVFCDLTHRCDEPGAKASLRDFSHDRSRFFLSHLITFHAQSRFLYFFCFNLSKLENTEPEPKQKKQAFPDASATRNPCFLIIPYLFHIYISIHPKIYSGDPVSLFQYAQAHGAVSTPPSYNPAQTDRSAPSSPPRVS